MSRGWPQLLQALDKMKHKNMNVLLLGGVLEGNDVLMAEAKRLKIDHRIHIKERISYELMFDFLLCADLGLMLYQPGIRNHNYAFPIKLYDYMLAGLPVIAPNFAIEVTPIVETEKCGCCIDTSDIKEIAQTLDWFCNNPSQAKEMGKRGRQAVLTKYNWEAENHKLISIYEKLTGIQ